MLAELEIRCVACRNGLVCAQEWEAWYARADEIELSYEAEHGSVQGLEGSQEWQLLVEDRPSGPEEIECAACNGTGVLLTETGRAVLAWAKVRIEAA